MVIVIKARARIAVVLRRYFGRSARVAIGSTKKANSGGRGVVLCWLAVVSGVAMVTVKVLGVDPGGM